MPNEESRNPHVSVPLSQCMVCNERLIAVEHHISGPDGKNGMRGELRDLKKRLGMVEIRLTAVMAALLGGKELLERLL